MRGALGKKTARLQDRPLSYRRAMERIRLLWREGRVSWTKHGRERLKERKFDMLDVEHLVLAGRVTEHARSEGSWTYRVDGTSVEGSPMAAVFALRGDLLTLITVMARRR